MVSAGTRRAYCSYWNRVVEQWGGRRRSFISCRISDGVGSSRKANVVQRRNGRSGRTAQEDLVAALRCLYRHAEDDGLIAEAGNPARKVGEPRRLPSTRRAVPDARLAEINQAAAAGGNDPELDTLILRLHTETACRRGGALGLRPQGLDPDQCLVLLREGNGPLAAGLPDPNGCLIRHARERHAPPGGQLLRYRDGRAGHLPPLRRPVGAHRPCPALGAHAAGQPHWLRHATYHRHRPARHWRTFRRTGRSFQGPPVRRGAAADRPAVQGARAMRSWPLLVLAALAAAEV